MPSEPLTLNWTRVDRSLPVEGVPVLTLSPGGQQQVLKRVGRLWFFPDGSMYVYYVPAYWRPISQIG